MLRVVDLYAKVGGNPVLKGVSMEMAPGEVVILTGPNGSGKSTLARAIMGDERVEIEKGKIFVGNEDITDLPPEERFKKGLFLTFQMPPEFEGIRIGDFLLRISGKTGEEAIKELKALVKEVGLPRDILFRELHRGLSGGERKRVELLQALFLKPKYVIFDEIDSGVDIESVEMIVEKVKELSERGSGVLFITHNPLSLKLLKGRTLKMEGGKIVENSGKG